MCVLTFDIGGTSLLCALFNDQAEIIWEQTFPSPGQYGGEAVTAEIITLAQAIKKDYPFQKIAIVSAGQIDPQKGQVVFATDNIPEYSGCKLAEKLQGALHCPVLVENDVNGAALGEYYFGAARGEDYFLTLTYGTGIGGAIIYQGKLLHGRNFAAGEWGHIVTHGGGLPCTCGGQGCYEQYASTKALLREAEKLLGTTVDGTTLFSAYQNNLQMAALVEQWLEEITFGLISLIHIFNPPLLVLGGGVMETPDLTQRIADKVMGKIMPSYRPVSIVPAALGNRAGIYGAYYLSLQQG